MLAEDELEAHGYAPDVHLLATDTAVVVPVDKVVHVLVTGADVIHAWTIPAFGVKIDAVPGRLNETWFQAEEEGIYFGQCSELCGKNHSYMPITVKVVSQEAYDAWLTGRSTSTAAPGPRRPRRRRGRGGAAGRHRTGGRGAGSRRRPPNSLPAAPSRAARGRSRRRSAGRTAPAARPNRPQRNRPRPNRPQRTPARRAGSSRRRGSRRGAARREPRPRTMPQPAEEVAWGKLRAR